MQIKIKKALLEGHQPEQIITEAVHANHPELNKKLAGIEFKTSKVPVFSKTLNSDVMVDKKVQSPNQVQQNRNDFAKTLKNLRNEAQFSKRDAHHMYGPEYAYDYGVNRDNYARLISQTGSKNEHDLNEKLPRSSIGPFLKVAKLPTILTAKPRNIPITKEGIKNQYIEANNLGLHERTD